MVCGQLGIDVDMIGAVQVKDAVGATLAYHACMMSRDLWVRQHHRVIRPASDGEFRITQSNWTHRSQYLLLRSRSIIENEGNKRTILITDTENITTI